MVKECSFILLPFLFKNSTMNFSPSTPILRIFDEVKTKEFYLDYLGFKIDWEYRHVPELPNYLQISKGACAIHLSEHHGDSTPGASIRIECDALEDYLNDLSRKNYKYLNPSMVSQPWGCREVILIDPFGNKLTFFDNKNKNE